VRQVGHLPETFKTVYTKPVTRFRERSIDAKRPL